MLRTVVLPDKPKRFDFPAAEVTVEPVARQARRLRLHRRQAGVLRPPEAPAFDGAFDDASFLLLPGEKRTVAFRSYDGRMPALADLDVRHLAETYASSCGAKRMNLE